MDIEGESNTSTEDYNNGIESNRKKDEPLTKVIKDGLKEIIRNTLDGLQSQGTITANMNEEVSGVFALDVEYRIREITSEALKFAKHSKRSALSPLDVKNALQLRTIEQLVAFPHLKQDLIPPPPGVSLYLPLTTIPNIPWTAKKKKKRQKIATEDEMDLGFGLNEEKTQDLEEEDFEEEQIEFDGPLTATPPPPPKEPYLSVHWLAIDGAQPKIRENPLPPKEETRQLLPPSKKMKIEHVLSKELQLYYDKVTAAIKSNDEKLLHAVSASLSQDAGLDQLLPYFAKFIAEEVAKNIHNLGVLTALVRMVSALVSSSQFSHLELYLHQLLPSVMTCIVGKHLCDRATDNHWELREVGANVVVLICKKFGELYPSLQPQIAKVFIDALLDPSKPLTTHYGCIVGLLSLGPDVVRELLLPNMAPYAFLLESELNNSSNPIKQNEARKCQNKLLEASVLYYRFLSLDLFSNAEVQRALTGIKGLQPLNVPDHLKQLLSKADPEYFDQIYSKFGDTLVTHIQKKLKEKLSDKISNNNEILK